MREKTEKPAPKQQLESGQAETKASGKTTIDFNYSLPQKNKKYNGFVSSVLLSGAKNAIEGTELAKILTLKDLRNLTQQ